MKYNLNKKSKHISDLIDDRFLKSKKFNSWFQDFISIIEEDNFEALKIFVKNNGIFLGFDYFLLSALAYVNSVYDYSIYEKVLKIVKELNKNVERKINENAF